MYIFSCFCTATGNKSYFLQKASERGIKVMKADWVAHVWKRSLVSDISATDGTIVDEFKCPMFYNLRVTASSLTENEKNKIRKIIDSNGEYIF